MGRSTWRSFDHDRGRRRPFKPTGSLPKFRVMGSASRSHPVAGLRLQSKSLVLLKRRIRWSRSCRLDKPLSFAIRHDAMRKSLLYFHHVRSPMKRAQMRAWTLDAAHDPKSARKRIAPLAVVLRVGKPGWLFVAGEEEATNEFIKLVKVRKSMVDGVPVADRVDGCVKSLRWQEVRLHATSEEAGAPPLITLEAPTYEEVHDMAEFVGKVESLNGRDLLDVIPVGARRLPNGDRA